MKRPKFYIVVALIASLAAGLWLRWDGLAWGRASHAQFHPDEPRFVEQADALDHGGLLRKSYVFGFGEAIRVVHADIPSIDYADIARDLSLVSGMLLCLVVFGVACELKLSFFEAALAGALTSLNTLCVIHSHFGTADMTYVLLLYLFSFCVLREWLLIAAVVAGAAMATKFGVILVPSLLWLAWRQRVRGLLLPAIAALVFIVAQNFTFDGESIRMISLSMRQDNTGGFEHEKWLNVITYLGVAIRALGIPAFIFALIGLARTRWRAAVGANVIPVKVWIAFLPFALHAIGLLAINATFPRHLLPLIPLLLIAAATGIEKLPRFRSAVAAICLVWSGLLAWSDGRVFANDPREIVANIISRVKTEPEMVGKIWADRFFDLPLGCRPCFPPPAQIRILDEAEFWRFERSEINPLRAPDARELYHATPDDLAWYDNFKAAVVRGEWRKVFSAGPELILPEQFLYAAAWGSFEKFAGKCAVYERAKPRVPTVGKTAP